MNQNLTQRERLSRTARGDQSFAESSGTAGARPTVAGGTPALPGGTKERLAREILAVSGPMRRPDRHQHWLLTLEVDVLKKRLEILVKEKLTTDGHR